MTEAEFRQKLKERYGDKFDDSEFVFQDTKVKGKLICNKCGKVMMVRPNDLFGIKDYHNCSTNTKKLTLEEVKERLNFVHSNYFGLDKLNVDGGVNSKVTVTCPIHGDIEMKLNALLDGKNCKYCNKEDITHMINKLPKRNKSTKRLDKNEVIKRINEIFGEDRYDISELEYKNYKTPMTLICHEKDEFGEEHGRFERLANHLFRGEGCSKCGGNYHPTTEEFIEIAKKKRNDVNVSFEKTDYKTIHTQIIITCHEKYPNGEEHGDFIMTPANFIHARQNCPKCTIYKMEQEIRLFLIENNIEFIEQCNFRTLSWLRNEEYSKGGLKLDFYLPKHNVAIECQGEQHFMPYERFGGKEALDSQIKRDKLKYKLCEENGVKLFYYTTVNENIQKYFCFRDKNELLIEINKYNANKE